jgi:hypothetical protein
MGCINVFNCKYLNKNVSKAPLKEAEVGKAQVKTLSFKVLLLLKPFEVSKMKVLLQLLSTFF